MAIILALENLLNNVTARFATEGTLIANTFGWKAPERQSKEINRIIWVPGDGSGSLGDIGGPRYPGGLPERPLAMLDELFTCWIIGADPQAIQDDLAQYHQTRLNYDAWVRAVYLAAHGTYKIKQQSWDITRKEGRFGAMIKVVGSVQAVIPDSPLTIAPVDTVADAVAGIGASTDPDQVITPDPPDDPSDD
jgi:hypothetical protein